MERGYRKYIVVMFLCFLLGGFSLMLYFIQVYSIVWEQGLVVQMRPSNGGLMMPFFNEETRPFQNVTDFNISAENNSLQSRRPIVLSQTALLLSPFSLILLFVGIVSLLSGMSIWSLIRDREIKSTRKKVIDMLLLPDEKAILNEIERCGGSVTQRDLVERTGMSRVKVHRVVRSLEMKNIIAKHQYGMTNKIIIKK
jgi:hypothetical protein